MREIGLVERQDRCDLSRPRRALRQDGPSQDVNMTDRLRAPSVAPADAREVVPPGPDMDNADRQRRTIQAGRPLASRALCCLQMVSPGLVTDRVVEMPVMTSVL